MDNRLLNINGKTKGQLELAMAAAFLDDYDQERNAVGWSITKEHGLVFYYIKTDDPNYSSFPTKMDARSCADIAWVWLQDKDRIDVKLSEWCNDYDHDGSNSYGWQIYLEDWGHISNEWFVICGVKPAYCWYGK